MEKQKFESLEDAAIRKAKICYEGIQDLGRYYMDMTDDALKITALWIIGTYVHKEFNSFPFLFFNAMRGSGKSRVLNFIANLAWQAKLTNNITESVLFRTARKNTIVIDEVESIVKKEKATLRELLNSAYKKGSTVERMKKIRHKEGEDLIVEKFDLYTPVAMANIGGMEEVLSDRCIPIILEKSDNAGKIKLIEDFDTNPAFYLIKRTFNEIQCSLCSVVTKKKLKKLWNLYISMQYNNYIHTLTTLTTLTTHTTLDAKNYDFEELGEDNENKLNELLPIFKKIDSLEINGRNLELFFPLIILSYVIDPSLFDDILRIAKEYSTQKKDFEIADSPDIALFQFIADKDPLEYYAITDLLRDFKEYFTSDDSDRDWLTTRWLGKALRRLKLVVANKRIARGMQVVLDVAKAKDKGKMFKSNEVKGNGDVENNS